MPTDSRHSARPPGDRRQAFTLIELLVVIAVISILALIALPNFLEAQTRAKVSRCLADMRSMATAIEAYAVDNNAYPRGRTAADDPKPDNLRPLSRRVFTLTTPIAYISSLPFDVFIPTAGNNGGYEMWEMDTYDYYDHASDMDEDLCAQNSTRGCAWRLAGAGPDLWASYGMIYDPPTKQLRSGYDYDPTNGSTSAGDIVRTGARVVEFSLYD